MAFAFAKLTKNFFKFSFSLCVRVLCGARLRFPCSRLLRPNSSKCSLRAVKREAPNGVQWSVYSSVILLDFTYAVQGEKRLSTDLLPSMQEGGCPGPLSWGGNMLVRGTHNC